MPRFVINGLRSATVKTRRSLIPMVSIATALQA